MGKYKDENGKTRVGALLQSMGDVAKPILSAAGSLTGNSWLNTIADGIKTSTDLKTEQKELLLTEIELSLRDIENARESNNRIQESENASWLAKNTMYILALLVVIAAIGTMIIKVEATVAAGVVQMAMLVLSFFFGSSIKDRF